MVFKVLVYYGVESRRTSSSYGSRFFLTRTYASPMMAMVMFTTTSTMMNTNG